ncbi:hypothetical protein HS125_14730 [bacterium]|nr:hypothetical protein [bacterium]
MKRLLPWAVWCTAAAAPWILAGYPASTNPLLAPVLFGRYSPLFLALYPLYALVLLPALYVWLLEPPVSRRSCAFFVLDVLEGNAQHLRNIFGYR